MKFNSFRSPFSIGLLLGGCMLALVCGGVWFALRGPAQPMHDGIPLTLWLQKYRSAPAAGKFLPVRLTPESDAAVKAMGTNAVPTLLRLMARPEFGLSEKIVELLNHERVPTAAKNVLFPLVSQRYNPILALLGFRALGLEAQAAIPALVSMLTSDDDFRCAVMALCTCGPKGAAALIEAIPKVNDPVHRGYILGQLEHAVTPLVEPEIAAFIAECVIEDPHPANRMRATQVLGSMTNSESITVPALSAALTHSELGVQLMAIDGLGRIGPAASAAVGNLQRLLDDSNPSLRQGASRALKSIQGDDVENHVTDSPDGPGSELGY